LVEDPVVELASVFVAEQAPVFAVEKSLIFVAEPAPVFAVVGILLEGTAADLMFVFLLPPLVALGALCFAFGLVTAGALFAVARKAANTAFGVPTGAVPAAAVAHRDNPAAGRLIVMQDKYTVGEVVIADICELVALPLAGL
jgi:hypothetical protein